jgi:superfamily II DNA or RNA helicase
MKITINSKLILSDVKKLSVLATIKERLTMPNPAYQEALKHGRYTGNIPAVLYFYEELENSLIMPRGFAYQLWRLLSKNGLKPELSDQRRLMPEMDFCFHGDLRDYQVGACSDVLKRDMALLVAPTGAGKTAMGLWLVSQRKQPCLIMVHTKELLYQWIERIQQFLGIAKDDIGIIGAGKFRIGERITVGMVQSLCRRAPDVVSHIGFLLVDEVHRAPAMQFAKVITEFDCKFMSGLSATPFRRDGLSKVIFLHVGDVSGTIEKDALINTGGLCQALVQQVQTNFSSSYIVQDDYSRAISELVEDSDRNNLISDTVATKTGSGVSLILSDRVQHLLSLAVLLKDKGIDPEVLTGQSKQKDRLRILHDLKCGKCKFLLATSQLIGEGFDLAEIERVFLTTPIKFSGKLIQCIGRALRPAPGKLNAFVYDFVDINEAVLATQAEARLRTYEGQGFEICF